MYLKHLSLTNFRNFTRLDVDVPSGSIVIVGDNAQGKTSLLEAIYFFATLVSFHATSDRQLINFLAGREQLSVSRLVADFLRGVDSHQMEIRIIKDSNGINGVSRVRKEVLVDGVKIKANQAVGKLNAVLFLPQMLRVIEGAPDERRRYLNLALAQVISYYPAALSDYNRTLSQRNALLKGLSERQGDPSELDFWDVQLATYGAQILYARIQVVQEMERMAARVLRELTRGEEVLRFRYQPAYDPLPHAPGQFELPLDSPVDRSGYTVDQIRQGFIERLQKLRSEEIARGVTTVGPHRDELRFLSNGVDLGVYGSRGQVRTAMLALKMAEVTWMKEKTGAWPVLLLDEVLAELDTQRRVDLLDRLEDSEQVLLTTTDLNLFSSDYVHKATLWNVQGGLIKVVRNEK
jgi:DNA replication and repair protein RecF